MYKELLGIVRGKPQDEEKEESKDEPETFVERQPKQRQKWAKEENYKPNMTVVPEEDQYETTIQKKEEFDQFTFIGEGINLANNMESVENVREYLELELGKDKLNKIYPILRDFGDQILIEENQELLIKALSPYLTRQQVRKYSHFFSIYVFFELQADDFGGGEQGLLYAS